MSELHKFLFEGLPVRGMLVRRPTRGRSCSRAARRRTTPSRRRCARCSARWRGRRADAVQHQVQRRAGAAGIRRRAGAARGGRGAADLAYRATAKVVGAVDASAQLEAMVNLHGNQGRCAITLTRKDKRPGQQPYQGVVPPTATSASRCSSSRRCWSTTCCRASSSTRLVLAADDRIAAGLLIQRLPIEGIILGPAPGRPAPRGAAGEAAGADIRQRGSHRPGRSIQPHRPLALDAHARGTVDAGCRHHPAPPVLGRRPAPLRASSPARAGPRFHCSCSRERAVGMLQRPGPRGDREHPRRAGAGSRSAATSAASSTTSTRSTPPACSCRPAASRRAAARSTEHHCCHTAGSGALSASLEARAHRVAGVLGLGVHSRCLQKPRVIRPPAPQPGDRLQP